MCILSRKTKYGLKALTFIARQPEQSPVQIAAIAKAENISHKYLESILLDLKKAGFLSSKKGKGGGYYLLKPASEIKMVDIIRLLDGPIAMLPCVSLNFYEKCDDCPDEAACSVNRLMIQVRDSTLNILRNNSLEDFSN